MSNSRFAFWLSSPNVAMAEMAAGIGYGAVVLDIEHGSFDLAILERFVPFLKGLGLDVIGKVLAPERGPIQQALDFGADAICIPHIEGYEHAKKICAFAKFPPKGLRSFAGGRTVNYGAPTDAWVAEQDKKTRCYPMIEDAGAIEEVEKIFSLDTVDGVFIGPTDLSLLRGRGMYKRNDADFADLKRVADAAKKAGKHWILPAWSESEKKFAFENNATQMALIMEHGAIYTGLKGPWDFTQNLAK